jgi:hypothetical protein
MNNVIKPLSEFSVDEKVKAFDELYDCALVDFEEVEREHYLDGDAAHYMWEQVMELLAYDNGTFWEEYNSLMRG